MHKILTVLLGIVFIFVVIFGQVHWKQQIASSSSSVTDAVKQVSEATEDQDKQAETSHADLLKYTLNWPAEALVIFKQALEKKRPYKILFVGNDAFGTETTGAYPAVKQKLVDTFGEGTVQVSIRTYKTTSTQVLSSGKQNEVAADAADMIILEPFILRNNGFLKIDKTIQDMTKMIEAIHTKNPKAVVMLQPSHPLYQAKNYPKEVAELKKYAEENQIPYLDHWASWPDPNTVAIKEYLTADQSAPSDKGYQVWSDYLIKYLVSE
ncbi:SGNH/GDSL hydrolase family protein [Neobacillus sp. Marseille-QA0830]